MVLNRAQIAVLSQVPDGKYCAPHCSSSVACPPVPDSSAVTPQCLVTDGTDPSPTLCAMVCTDHSQCPGESSCVEASSTIRVCMYHGNGPPGPPAPPPPSPPPAVHSLAGRWQYRSQKGVDVYEITEETASEFTVSVESGGSGWTSARVRPTELIVLPHADAHPVQARERACVSRAKSTNNAKSTSPSTTESRNKGRSTRHSIRLVGRTALRGTESATGPRRRQRRRRLTPTVPSVETGRTRYV